MTIIEVITEEPQTIVEVITEQPLTPVEINSFRSVPVGINLTASGDGDNYLSDDGTYKPVSGGVSQVNSDWNSVSGVSQILNKPTLGTSSSLNVPASGDAASGEIVKGDDTRLSDARTPLNHTHVIADVTGLQTALDGKFNTPLGDTTQYLAGDGSLIAFPVAGQAGTLVRQVRNETGSTITKGTVVYISGASGNKALVSKGLATSDATSAQTFGVVQADINTNQNGYVVVRGDLVGINTSAYPDGTQLYLSGVVAGTFTSIKPVAPLHMVYVGVVTRQHVNQGQIEVAIQNGYEMDELHDVLIVSKTNKDVISYDSVSDLWKNKQLASIDISDFNTAADARVVAGITGKENTITAGTTAQYWRGDKSWQTLNSSAVGLGNVNNTSDANKPVSTATQTALNLKYDATNPSGYTTKAIINTSGAATLPNTANTDYVVFITGNHSQTMPSAVGNTNRYDIKNNHVASVGVLTTSSQTIDGSTTLSLSPQSAVTLISNGSNWSIF